MPDVSGMYDDAADTHWDLGGNNSDLTPKEPLVFGLSTIAK